jgi:hypothetical protein
MRASGRQTADILAAAACGLRHAPAAPPMTVAALKAVVAIGTVPVGVDTEATFAIGIPGHWRPGKAQASKQCGRRLTQLVSQRAQ